MRVFFYLEDRERTLDSPTDKIMLSLTAFADELEREKARQRTYDAMLRKARNGRSESLCSVCSSRCSSSRVLHGMFRSDAAHRAEPKGPDSHVAPARPDVSGGPASRARLCVSQFRASVVALCVRRRRHVCPARNSINNRLSSIPGPTRLTAQTLL